MHAREAIVLTLGIHTLTGPHQADHLDRLLQRRRGLTGRAHVTAHRPDRLPERARTQRQFESASRHQAEAGRGFRHRRRRAKRQECDVGKHAHPLGPGQQRAHQRPAVEEFRLVRVILHADQVESGLVGEGGEFERVGQQLHRRGHERPELHGPAVIGHGGRVPSRIAELLRSSTSATFGNTRRAVGTPPGGIVGSRQTTRKTAPHPTSGTPPNYTDSRSASRVNWPGSPSTSTTRINGSSSTPRSATSSRGAASPAP